MDNVIRAILVRDSHGDELTLYEYGARVPYLARLGLGRGGGTTRLALDTGETVERVDDDSFVIVATGERLVRVR